MWRPRIIPVLLLRGEALVKSRRFKNFTYLGDPINAARIFNELRADELIFLDISATREGRSVSLAFVRQVGEETNMPFAVGGGIRSLDEIRSILEAGAEKVVLGTHAVEDPSFISRAADAFGASTISVCIDVRRGMLGREKVWSRNGSKSSRYSPEGFSAFAEKSGCGEVIVQSIERDGMMAGYDIDLIRRVSQAVSIPVVALGGAGNTGHLCDAIKFGYASAVGAASLFVFHGTRRGVLFSYVAPGEVSSCAPM